MNRSYRSRAVSSAYQFPEPQGVSHLPFLGGSEMPVNDPRRLQLNSINYGEPKVRNTPVDEELSVFSNTTFYDMDVGCSTDIATTVDELLMQQEKKIQGSTFNSEYNADASAGSSLGHPTAGLGFSDLEEFSLAGELPAINTYTQAYEPLVPSITHTSSARSRAPSLASSSYDPRSYTSVKDQEPQTQPHQTPREASPQSGNESAEPGTRRLVEEDKRRRNTAASARFRIKKKLREQEMERNTRHMQSHIDDLEKKIKQLEMENRWLKNLVVERNESRNATEIHEMRARMLGEE